MVVWHVAELAFDVRPVDFCDVNCFCVLDATWDKGITSKVHVSETTDQHLGGNKYCLSRQHTLKHVTAIEEIKHLWLEKTLQKLNVRATEISCMQSV